MRKFEGKELLVVAHLEVLPNVVGDSRIHMALQMRVVGQPVP